MFCNFSCPKSFVKDSIFLSDRLSKMTVFNKTPVNILDQYFSKQEMPDVFYIVKSYINMLKNEEQFCTNFHENS